MRFFLIGLLTFCVNLAYSQENSDKKEVKNFIACFGQDYNTKYDGIGGYFYKTGLNFGVSSEKELPFWLQANKFGLVPNHNYGLWDWGLKKEFYGYKKFDWSFGVDGVISYGNKANALLRNYFVGVRYGKIRLFVGAKANPILYDGLSSTSGNEIQSANARPYPKIMVEIPYTNIPYTKGILQFKGLISEGVMIDDRYVDKPRVHHKNLYLKAEKGRFAFEVGINHYAQWAGTSPSPRFGKLPSSLGAYKDMFFALDESNYDQIAASFDKNRVGNHLGMLAARFHYKGEKYSVDAYRQIIFEDHSGQNFFNRDALNGIYIKRNKENAWLQSFLLEYCYTKKQSGDKSGKKPNEDKLYTGQDNYFNHSIYSSGWTSYGYTIGTPFITPIKGEKYALGISNNRLSLWHGGISGYILQKFPYKAMLSCSDNIGTYSKPIDKQQMSAYFEFTIPLEVRNYPLNITFGGAIDNGEYLKDNYGAFIKISTNGKWGK